MVHVISGPHSRLLVRSICELPAEKRVRGKAMIVSFLVQWESGRTRHNLLHAVRKSKAKKADHFRHSLERPVPKFFRPMSRHTGQSSQLFADANDGNAQFLPKLARAVVWHTRHKSFKRLLRQPTVDNHRNLFGDCDRRCWVFSPVAKRLVQHAVNGSNRSWPAYP